MKDLYLKPEVELKEFDIVDVITGSPNPGEGVVANEDPTNPSQDGWTIYGSKSLIRRKLKAQVYCLSLLLCLNPILCLPNGQFFSKIALFLCFVYLQKSSLVL